jgi:hypothetical protein
MSKIEYGFNGVHQEKDKLFAPVVTHKGSVDIAIEGFKRFIVEKRSLEFQNVANLDCTNIHYKCKDFEVNLWIDNKTKEPVYFIIKLSNPQVTYSNVVGRRYKDSTLKHEYLNNILETDGYLRYTTGYRQLDKPLRFCVIMQLECPFSEVFPKKNEPMYVVPVPKYTATSIAEFFNIKGVQDYDEQMSIK